MSSIKLQNLIGSTFSDADSGETMPIFNPSTGKQSGTLPASASSDVNKAIQAAETAFPAWSSKTPAARAAALNAIADAIEARLPEFAAAESADQGKPVSVASTVDIPRAVANFRFFAGAILHSVNESTMSGSGDAGSVLNYITRQPVGVCALISPWNLPLYLLTWKIAPCIAVGNTCVAKPSEFTSVTAWMMAGIMRDLSISKPDLFPPGTVNIIFGDGPRAGAALTSDARVPLISFTGGTVTGQAITVASAKHNPKLSLELGGKNAGLIFADADFDLAVSESVRAAFSNQGEICLCSSRLFVQRAIYEDFVAAFVKKVNETWTVGDPADPSTKMGPLVSAVHLEKVKSYVKLAQEEGGKVLTGGVTPANLKPEHAGGYWLAPTVITGLSATCRTTTEEIFGPVVTITPFDTEEEALAAANGVKYGLASTVFTKDLNTAHRVATKLQAGYVWINTWMLRDLRVPFGGWKASGVGREGGDLSIDFYTEAKTVCIKL